jgi:ubiquinone biosynthesis monooxygenase Coq6
MDHCVAALFEAVRETEKVEILEGEKIKTIIPGNANTLTQIELESGLKFKSRLVIGSDGMMSFTRKAHNIDTWGYSYNQKGIVTTMETLSPLPAAFQRFLPSGPLAILPLWNQYCSLVWSCPEDMCERLLALNEEEFLDALNDAFHSSPQTDHGGVLESYGIKKGGYEAPPFVTDLKTGRFSFPLGLQHANSYAKDRVALLGDAAH